jgi:hypothetical protein
MSMKYDSSGNEDIIFIAEKTNNKIKTMEMKSGNFECKTWAINVDTKAKNLGGLVVNNNNGLLYVAVTGGIYSYSMSLGDSSKTLYAGRLWQTSGTVLSRFAVSELPNSSR